MGAVRTTFAMCASVIVRRRQLVLKGLPDPYDVASLGVGGTPGRHTHNGSSPFGLGADDSRASTVCLHSQ